MNARQRRNKKRKNIIYIDNPLNGAFSLSHLDLDGMIQLQNLIKKSREFSKNTVKYENVLNDCFLEKPELIKFDEKTTDEDIDNFFDKL